MSSRQRSWIQRQSGSWYARATNTLARVGPSGSARRSSASLLLSDVRNQSSFVEWTHGMAPFELAIPTRRRTACIFWVSSDQPR
jgi:hypothetical protein